MTITPGFVRTADGSSLIELGQTRVICTASIVEGVPRWRAGSGLGWLTAEYGMLPASTSTRKARPVHRPDSRSVEIQRLIGRVLRSVVRPEKLGEKTLYLDCDVLEADGGTRTAAITGAYVALALAAARGVQRQVLPRGVVRGSAAAVSVGILDGRAVLDLDYVEDAAAAVDMNVAMTGDGKFLELQGTSEGKAFDAEELQEMLRLARRGIRRLRQAQKRALADGLKE